MIAHYGYADGSGEYYITIDTDKCDGCGECVRSCPKDIFGVAVDDYNKAVAVVREELSRSISYICSGYYQECISKEVNCHNVCKPEAISHTW
jgi:ferredoxin